MGRWLVAVAAAFAVVTCWALWRSGPPAPSLEAAPAAAAPADVATAALAEPCDAAPEQAARVAGAPADAVRVTVVDRSGRRRAGAQVALWWTLDQGARPRLERAGTTDACGQVVVAGMAQRRAKAEYAGPRAVGLAATVLADGLDVERVPVDLDPLAAEARVTLPSSGSVLVVVCDAWGRPLTQRFSSGLSLPPHAGSEKLELAGVWQPGAGGGEFAVVPAGRPFLWHVFVPDATPVQHHGLRDGEHARVTWRLPAEWTIVAARLWDERGVPAAGVAGRLVVDRPPLPDDMRTVCSDGAGVVRAALVGPAARSLWFEEVDASGRPGRRARPRRPIALGPGVNDLGDWRLEPLPLLVALEVVDERGHPVAQLESVLQLHRQAGAELRPPCEDPGERVRLAAAGGRYEFRGAADPGPLVVSLAAAGYVPVRARAVPRGDCVRITLERGGSVNATFRPALALRLTLEDEAGRPGPEPELIARGAVRFAGLAAGVYTLAARLPAELEPLVTLPGLRVAPPAPCADPRLEAIELGAHVRTVVVRVRDEAGKPVPAARVELPHDGVRGSPHSVAVDAAGCAELVLSRPAPRYVVSALGYASQDIAGFTGDVAVTLVRAAGAR